MRKYETVFISDPDLSDQARSDLYDKVRNIIANEKGILLDFDEWGNKKMAYEIYKKNRGHYVCVTYGGSGELVKELERNFRLTDDVLKFMTILLEKDADQAAMEEEARQMAETRKEQPQPAEKDEESAGGEEEPESSEEEASEETDTDDEPASSDETESEAAKEETE